MSQTKEHYIADIAEVPVGGRLLVTVEGREIGIFNLNGTFYALRNHCFHQGGPLCEGKITGTLTARKENNWRFIWEQEGEILRCPWHSMEFHIPTGQCLPFPNRHAQSYPVTIKDEKIFVSL
jgi:nitrite reductase/ring-hydroxylating ferredoxin subunit